MFQSAPKRIKKQPQTDEEHACKWVGCDERKFPSLASLVSHVSNQHLAQQPQVNQSLPVRYSCQWEGCSRFDVEQPSRFALISHCRTHTGEKPYFCPIPECEKHFTRSDALAKHVKGVHDLHQHRDAISLMRHRSDRDLSALLDLDTMTEEKYEVALRKDYEARMPWWFLRKFVDVLRETDVSLETLQRQPVPMKQHEVAYQRYARFLDDPDPEDLLGAGADDEDSPDYHEVKELLALFDPHDDDVSDSAASLEEAAALCDKLSKRYLTARRINEIVNKHLHDAVREKRTLWVKNQILLDANIQDGLPRAKDSVNGSNGSNGSKGVSDSGDVHQDELDEVLLLEGITSG